MHGGSGSQGAMLVGNIGENSQIPVMSILSQNGRFLEKSTFTSISSFVNPSGTTVQSGQVTNQNVSPIGSSA